MAEPFADPFLRSLTDATEMGIILLDEEGRVTLWNAWVVEASDVTEADALGRRIPEICPSLAESRIDEAIGQTLASGLSAMLSSSLNRTLFPLERNGARLNRREAMHQIVVVKPLNSGERRACLIQIFDVTSMASREALLRQQARTMEALADNYRLSELHNRAIVDNSADAIVAFAGVSGDFNPVHINEDFAKRPPDRGR